MDEKFPGHRFETKILIQAQTLLITNIILATKLLIIYIEALSPHPKYITSLLEATV